MEAVVSLKSWRNRIIPDIVTVLFPSRIIAGMETLRRFFYVFYNDISRQLVIDCRKQLCQFYIGMSFKIGNLPSSMRSRIRSAWADNFNFFPLLAG